MNGREEAGQTRGGPGSWESDFALFCLGLGKFPLLFWSRISTHHSDDDGCVVHHVLQVRSGQVGVRGGRDCAGRERRGANENAGAE